MAADQHSQVLFYQTTSQPLFPRPTLLHGVVLAQAQILALGLVEHLAIGLGPSVQPIQISLQSLPTLKQINSPTSLGIVCTY